MNYPELGEDLPAAHKSVETLELLRRRRSTTADCLGGPGPDRATLDDILKIAARVPDHRRVAPFRFIVFEGEARASFGKTLRDVFVADNPDASEEKIAYEQNRFQRAPIIVGLISNVDKTHRTPEWEQILSAGAAGQNLLLAACAFGFAAQWLTEWYAFDERIANALSLGKDERIAGFIYIGTATQQPKERGRPDMSALISRYGA
ncbi:nitroreductase family protein [Hyphococcus lacteus]|uniref:Putative NAD(P)H nitroreductase n=1 Tax=Hyphococcus lacteus TaxID=3143536 RepID=A0ABV3Z615_9PROT